MLSKATPRIIFLRRACSLVRLNSKSNRVSGITFRRCLASGPDREQENSLGSFVPRSAETISITSRNDADEIARLDSIFTAQKNAFMDEPYPTIEVRKERLISLMRAIMIHRDEMKAALVQDFATHPEDFSDLIEVLGLVGRIGHCLENIDEWSAKRPRELNKDSWGESKGYILPCPKGVVLNLAPWNFPLDIGIGPTIDMITAGNRVVVKPSDLSPACNEVLRNVFQTAFPETSHGVRVIEVVSGGLDLAKAIVKLPWNHVLYTGGTAGAKLISKALSENLVPCTFELGGKCPTIFHSEDDMTQENIDHIMGVKLIKNGQMCVTVDYVMIPAGTEKKFLDMATNSISRMVTDYTSDPELPSIITNEHANRIAGLVDDSRDRGFEVIQVGGEMTDIRRPPFTFIMNPSDDAKVMQEEIFGPVLPVKSFGVVDEAVEYVRGHERPLSVSLFTGDDEFQEWVNLMTMSGAFAVNSGPAMAAAQAQLGFGGTGMSGYGRHHGKEGFDEFSNLKAVFERKDGGVLIDNGSILLPPYGRELTRGVIDSVVKQILG